MRLSGLYIKLFAAFWLVLVVTIVLVFWLARWGEDQIRPAEPSQLPQLQQLAGQLSKRPLEQVQRRLKSEKGPLGRRSARLFLFDPRGGALHQGETPAALAAFVAETLTQPQPMRQGSDGWMWVGPLKVTKPDQALNAYLRLPLPPGRLALMHSWRKQPWKLLTLLVLLSGALMGAVAWHLSRPLKRLEKISQQLAEGDLASRVDPAITRRHDEIGALARRFNRMAEAISASFTAQKRLLSDVSHELRSPLTRLQLAASLLQRQQPDEAHLARIQREADRLEQMIASLLSLSREQLNAKQRQPIRIAELLQTCLKDARFEAEACGRRVELRQLQDVTLQAAPQQLSSAISNLLANAIRHARQNIWLSAQRTGPDNFEICVEDDGEGVPQDQLQAIFRPFYRVSDARSREDGGTGLGLAIVASVATAHGGEVFAQNRPEGGLRVILRLPCAESDVL